MADNNTLQDELEEINEELVEETTETENVIETDTSSITEETINRLAELVDKATKAVELIQSLIPEAVVAETHEITTPTESTTEDISELDKRIMEGWLN